MSSIGLQMGAGGRKSCRFEPGQARENCVGLLLPKPLKNYASCPNMPACFSHDVHKSVQSCFRKFATNSNTCLHTKSQFVWPNMGGKPPFVKLGWLFVAGNRATEHPRSCRRSNRAQKNAPLHSTPFHSNPDQWYVRKQRSVQKRMFGQTLGPQNRSESSENHKSSYIKHIPRSSADKSILETRFVAYLRKCVLRGPPIWGAPLGLFVALN